MVLSNSGVVDSVVAFGIDCKITQIFTVEVLVVFLFAIVIPSWQCASHMNSA